MLPRHPTPTLFPYTTLFRSRSYVIAVSVDSAEPKKAKQIVDAITDFYIVDQLNAKFDATKRATEWLDERLGELRRSEEHTSELQSLRHLVCRLLLEKKKRIE